MGSIVERSAGLLATHPELTGNALAALRAVASSALSSEDPALSKSVPKVIEVVKNASESSTTIEAMSLLELTSYVPHFLAADRSLTVLGATYLRGSFPMRNRSSQFCSMPLIPPQTCRSMRSRRSRPLSRRSQHSSALNSSSPSCGHQSSTSRVAMDRPSCSV